MTTEKLFAACECGAIQFSVWDDFDYVGFCHCKDCQRLSGSAFATFGGIKLKHLEVTKGDSNIQQYEKSPDSVYCFCKDCGCNLFSIKSESGLAHIRLGGLDKRPSKRPQLHIVVESKADWYEICDELPQFERLPPG